MALCQVGEHQPLTSTAAMGRYVKKISLLLSNSPRVQLFSLCCEHHFQLELMTSQSLEVIVGIMPLAIELSVESLSILC